MPSIRTESRKNAKGTSGENSMASTRHGCRATRHVDEEETNSEKSQDTEEEDVRFGENTSDEGADDLLDDDDY